MGEKRSETEPAAFEEHGKPRPLEAIRAEQMGEDPGYETPGQVGQPARGVLVQVCMRCGREYTFEQHEPPAELVCDKCGNEVFRSFFTVTSRDATEADFRAATERDLAPDASPSDVTAADVKDLGNI